ncbi:MAG: class I SAM-dependent methyltransferase [Methylococcales bacterium]|nr:class I SAM-dependent methyltransferase [Methylococcales bacterium]
MSVDFYRAFEERYRGSQEQIKSRLRVYIPFIKPLIGLYEDAKAVDLGCGRGEWLELLKEEGFDAQGVDLDEGMLLACKALGLNTQVGEAVGFLKELPKASQVVVSGFHLVEHIPFADVQTLVQEALRVLKPGGLLILETPNPENIVVGSSNFYLDPTHQRPIPPLLLAFLPEHYGYEKTKIVRLQESTELHGTKPPRLLDVLNGASPDYSIVARKKGNAKILAATKKAFSKEYGLTLDNLAVRYDQEAEAKANQAEAKANQAEIALIAISNSTSWRLTEPLRWVSRIAKKTFELARVKSIKGQKANMLLFAHITLYLNRRQKLRGILFALLTRYAVLDAYIKRVKRVLTFGQAAPLSVTNELSTLTRRARRIYAEFKVSKENKDKEDA